MGWAHKVVDFFSSQKTYRRVSVSAKFEFDYKPIFVLNKKRKNKYNILEPIL